MRRRRVRAAMLVQLMAAGAVALLYVEPATGHSTGDTGHSGKQGATCNACHGGGAAPAVRFIGPQTVAVGTTVLFRFEVQSMRAGQRAAGCNVAASGGRLAEVDGEEEQVAGGELTHTTPQANVEGVAGWDFTWTAPLQPGVATLFAAGNSVNRNGQPTGDRASTTTLVVQVVDAATATPVVPTETPTPTVLPATETPTPSPGVTATRGASACAGDCDGSGSVTVNELVTGVGVALGALPIDVCRAADLDGDGHIGISELVAAVAAALSGCP